MRRLKNLAAGMLVVALVVSGTTALADTAYNTIDGSIDTSLEVVNFAAGATAAQTVTLRLTADSSYGETDPHGGCNLGGNVNDATLWQGGKTGSAALKLTATSSAPSVATVTSPAAFTNCANQAGYEQTLSVTPVGPGSTTVTFAINTAASKWRKNSNVQLNTASFAVNVAAPSNTAPTVAVTGFSDGDSFEKGVDTLPTPGCDASDAEDGPSNPAPTITPALDGFGLGSVTVTCSYTDAGDLSDSDEKSYSIVDTTNPTIGHAVSPADPDGEAGWYVTAPTVTFSCSDAGSGIASCLADDADPASDEITLGDGAGQVVGGTATDNVRLTATDSVTLSVDTTDPDNIAFSGGGISDGASYYFGSVPAGPTGCTADDATSGLASCDVTGGGSGVGSHSYTATATDNAGNDATATLSYTVLPWTLNGFYSPVDMNNVVNVAKAGSTVPLKFEIFSGTTELTNTSAIDTFTVAKQASCSGLYGAEDAIELYSTGGTALRYDTAGGQFIQNWKIPSGANICYRVTMTADDGSSKTALFKSR
ncbi:MAG: PxKF domain-containing protein [Actinomycetota bacterium]|nr:PxKF domain-containing protein [Actinomycetota bacterium]